MTSQVGGQYGFGGENYILVYEVSDQFSVPSKS